MWINGPAAEIFEETLRPLQSQVLVQSTGVSQLKIDIKSESIQEEFTRAQNQVKYLPPYRTPVGACKGKVTDRSKVFGFYIDRVSSIYHDALKRPGRTYCDAKKQPKSGSITMHRERFPDTALEINKHNPEDLDVTIFAVRRSRNYDLLNALSVLSATEQNKINEFRWWEFTRYLGWKYGMVMEKPRDLGTPVYASLLTTTNLHLHTMINFLNNVAIYEEVYKNQKKEEKDDTKEEKKDDKEEKKETINVRRLQDEDQIFIDGDQIFIDDFDKDDVEQNIQDADTDNKFRELYISSTILAMPGKAYLGPNTDVDIGKYLSLMVLPMVSMLFFPVMVGNLAMEHNNKLIVLMQIHMLLPRWFWAATYLWNFVLYLIVMAAYTITQVAIGANETHWGFFCLIVLLWGHAQIGLGVLIAAIFMNSGFLSLVSYFTIGLSASLAVLLNMIYQSDPWPALIHYFTPMAFVRGMTIIWIDNWDDSNWDDFIFCCCILAGFGTLMLMIGLLILLTIGDEVSPLMRLRDRLFRTEKLKKAFEDVQEGIVENEDTDVTGERKHVRDQRDFDVDRCDLIKLDTLGKKYPSSGPWAVFELSLGIPKGETFGLLGPNGAGKTTTISIMSGFTFPSYGSAKIQGTEVGYYNEEARKNLGVCPQFDYLYDELTTEEHFLLYSRIKGLPKKYEKILVRETAAFVGLDGDAFHKKTNGLSGGMKRRLTIGLALLSSPSVVLLDEPTTGLDPETRQEVWMTLAMIKEGRSLVITTHSMEEAEALCDRIGMMAQGRMRALGSPLHLKKKHGSGYKLFIQYEMEPEVVYRFVSKLAPGTKITKHEAGRILFSIPRENVKVSDIFDAMETYSKKLTITEWSFSESTLDEVFSNVTDYAYGKEERVLLGKEKAVETPMPPKQTAASESVKRRK